MDAPAGWPFADPPNLAVITLRAIMQGATWIAYVSRDEEDDGWQFHGPEDSDVDDATVVALHRVLALDPSIAELADLPPGWQAWRAAPDAPWQRARQRG